MGCVISVPAQSQNQELVQDFKEDHVEVKSENQGLESELLGSVCKNEEWPGGDDHESVSGKLQSEDHKFELHAGGAVLSVCGEDTRMKVNPTTPVPYMFICFLQMVKNNKNSIASGFFLNMNTADWMVVTSAHCIYDHDSQQYASKVTVTYKGDQSIVVTDQNNMYVAPEYASDKNSDYDYGIVIIRNRSRFGFGYKTLSDAQLNNRVVVNCGYPADKPRGTMWISGGEITSVTARKVFYMNDTKGGQSGSPVYTWYGGWWRVIAVHGYGGCPNSGVRICSQMINRFRAFSQGD